MEEPCVAVTWFVLFYMFQTNDSNCETGESAGKPNAPRALWSPHGWGAPPARRRVPPLSAPPGPRGTRSWRPRLATDVFSHIRKHGLCPSSHVNYPWALPRICSVLLRITQMHRPQGMWPNQRCTRWIEWFAVIKLSHLIQFVWWWAWTDQLKNRVKTFEVKTSSLYSLVDLHESYSIL